MCISWAGMPWSLAAQAPLPSLTYMESSQPHLEAGNGLPALVVGQPSLCFPLQGHCRKLELLDCDVSRPHLHAQGAGHISGRPVLWSSTGTDSTGLLWDKSATLCTGN